MRDIPAYFPKILDPHPPPLGRFVLRSRHRNTCHVEQKAWIDAVIAGLDAFAAEYAGARPFARQLGTIPGSHDVENACDRGAGVSAGNTCGLLDGAGLETLA